MKMKKVKIFLRNNIKMVIAFLVGTIIAGSIGVYATTIIASANVSYDNTSTGLISTNVQDALDEIYNNVKPTEFKKGDYVKMTPTKTSFTIPKTLTGSTSDRTINPSELNLWRVININDDKTVDMVSVYVSSTDVNFIGVTGYRKFVATLNYIAKQYENRKYTVGSRCMGYNGQTEYIASGTTFTTTTAPQTSSTTGNATAEAKGLGDVWYKTDTDLVNAACGNLVAYRVSNTSTATDYWIASRGYYYNSSTQWIFRGRCITAAGELGAWVLYSYKDSKFTDAGKSYAIRPIVTLKSNTLASSGSGTASRPYVLS